MNSKLKEAHKDKICGLCGKKEAGNWQRHFDRRHNKVIAVAWDGSNPLKSEPWCKNWQDVLKGAEPAEVAQDFFGGRPTSKPATNVLHTPI